MTLTYKNLQAALKDLKAAGKTNIKLNSTKAELQAEYDRLTTTIEPEVNPSTDNEIETAETPETLTITFHSFRDIIRQRRPLHCYRHPKAHGFASPKPEKRYDQLTHAEWVNDTLAFLDDMCVDEYDEIRYIAYLEYQDGEDEYDYIAA